MSKKKSAIFSSTLFSSEDEKKTVRPCSEEGCSLPGEFKAPYRRDQIREYIWFCLEHVRTYNKQWNYYQGMNAEEIECETRLDMTWQRHTWPFSHSSDHLLMLKALEKAYYQFNGKARHYPWDHAFEAMGGQKKQNDNWEDELEFNGAESKAVRLMGLKLPLTAETLKARYIEFAKRYHPDTNGGSQEGEAHLKIINQAYAILKNFLKKQAAYSSHKKTNRASYGKDY